jgi:Short C-terminal domain
MGLIKTAARVGVASAVHGRVQRRQQQRWAAQDQWQQAPPPPAAAPPAAAPPTAGPPQAAMADKLAQLKTLGELRDSGVLSEAEFEGAKQKVLQG